MKRNTILYLVLFVVFGVVAVMLLMKNTDNTLPQNLQDFAVNDTGAIDVIEIKDASNHFVKLEKKSSDKWMVNNKYKAQPSQVNILLETIKLVQVKNPVSMSMRDNVIKSLASEAIKVKLFSNGKLLKTYYVGGPTPDQKGTLMLLEGAREPYITHIPGFEGYLTTRYVTLEKEWRSTEVYHLNPSGIQEVKVTYPLAPDSSFVLTVDNNQFLIKQLEGDPRPQPMSSLLAKKYLAGFRGINFEQFPRLSQHAQDSISLSTPFAIISVKSSQEAAPVLKLYYKEADDRTKEVGEGNIDNDKFYGIIGDNHDEVVLMQEFVAGKLLPGFHTLAGKR